MSDQNHVSQPKYSYFAQITQALTYFTYVNKKGELQRISARARELYRILLSTSDVCYKSRDTLAFQCNSSPTEITNLKKELSYPIHELGNKPLITIRKSPKKGGGKPSDHIIVNDILPEGTAFMKAIYDFNKKRGFMPYEHVFMRNKPMSLVDLATSLVDIGFDFLPRAMSLPDINDKKDVSLNDKKFKDTNRSSACGNVDNPKPASLESLPTSDCQHSPQALIDRFSFNHPNIDFCSLPKEQQLSSYQREIPKLSQRSLGRWYENQGALPLYFLLGCLVSRQKKSSLDCPEAYIESLIKKKAYENHINILKNRALVDYMKKSGYFLDSMLLKTVWMPDKTKKNYSIPLETNHLTFKDILKHKNF